MSYLIYDVQLSHFHLMRDLAHTRYTKIFPSNVSLSIHLGILSLNWKLSLIHINCNIVDTQHQSRGLRSNHATLVPSWIMRRVSGSLTFEQQHKLI